jgi:hypothetical protein
VSSAGEITSLVAPSKARHPALLLTTLLLKFSDMKVAFASPGAVGAEVPPKMN